MRKTSLVVLAAFFSAASASGQADPSQPPKSKGYVYEPPTAEEAAPMRPEYLAELAKIHEPPEMTGKPMQIRKAASPGILKMVRVIDAIGSPEKATHEQRATAIRDLLEIADSKEIDDGVGRVVTYGAVAAMACLDGAEPRTVIGYANNAVGERADATGDRDDLVALRARMYMKAGDRDKALGDLERILAVANGRALADGGVDPRKESVPCGWSIADFDAFGDDPRALAAKGLYLSAFLVYGAEDRGTAKESDIRGLYKRAARTWRSPIPILLEATVDGIGSKHSMERARCIRADSGGGVNPDLVNACAKVDEGVRQGIRDLTMAIVIKPTFARALSMRANKYLQLAQAYHADGKPSRKLFELAIADYTAAIAAGGKDKHTLYSDRALALASIGKYKEAASGYAQAMKYAKNGVEDSPFVYQQLAGVYMKLGKFNEVADLLTQAIIHSSGGGMDSVIFSGGFGAFRTLYPEYGLLPDEILADELRRRYEPQFPQSWNADFISKGGNHDGKIASSILPELYVKRGDAYMKAGRRAEALADYRRVKSDAWSGSEQYLPKHMFFKEDGNRNHEMPESWPPPPTM